MSTNKNVSLFPGNRDRMGHHGDYADLSGDNIRAKELPDGGYELETSTINFSDARVFGHGELKPVANKATEKSPDFRGFLNEPDEGTGHKPGRYQIAAWRRTIKSGTNEGQFYLSLSMTPQ